MIFKTFYFLLLIGTLTKAQRLDSTQISLDLTAASQTTSLPYLELHHHGHYIQRYTNADMLFMENELMASLEENPNDSIKLADRLNRRPVPYNLYYKSGYVVSYGSNGEEDTESRKVTDIMEKMKQNDLDYLQNSASNMTYFDGKGGVRKLSLVEDLSMIIQLGPTYRRAQQTIRDIIPEIYGGLYSGQPYLIYYEPFSGKEVQLSNTVVVEIAKKIINMLIQDPKTWPFYCRRTFFGRECIKNDSYLKYIDGHGKEHVLSDDEVIAIRNQLAASANINPIERVLALQTPTGSKMPYMVYHDKHGSSRKLTFVEMVYLTKMMQADQP